MSLPLPRRTDVGLALLVILLIGVGLVMVFSASAVVAHVRFGDDYLFVRKQFIGLLIGLSLLAVTANLEFTFWRKHAATLLITSIVLLIATLVFSAGEINGAHRWINLGPLNFQTSELAKFAVSAYVAAWITTHWEKRKTIREALLPLLGVVGLVGVLMLAQPDLGTYTIIVMPVIAIMFVAGVSLRQVVVGFLALVLAGALVLIPAKDGENYRLNRIKTFVSGGNEQTKGRDYHVQQVELAIGSGGWFGRGIGKSGQKRLFLPEPHTDSVFAVAVEETGFVGGLFIIALLVAFIERCYRVALRVEDRFGMLLAVGIATWFGYQAFLNLAAMLGLAPLTGVPIPFLSYGGTALMINLAAFGVLLNISRYQRQDK
jgi:cell division protein FtsW